jgi:hypothetical protein
MEDEEELKKKIGKIEINNGKFYKINKERKLL